MVLYLPKTKENKRNLDARPKIGKNCYGNISTIYFSLAYLLGADVSKNTQKRSDPTKLLLSMITI